MSTAAPPPLGRFVLRTFLWLPPCFAAWYLCAPAITALAAGVASLIVHGFAPGLITAIERTGLDLAFVTTLEVASGPGQVGVLVPEVHPLTYTYGLALFAALMLAARAAAWKLAAGAAALLFFQGWGIAFDFLAHVGIKLGPDIAALAGLRGWRAEFIALAYQLGALVLPSLAPVVAWAAFNRPLIARLARRGARAASAPPETPTSPAPP